MTTHRTLDNYQYWLRLISLILGAVISLAVITWLLDILNANEPGAPLVNQVAAYSLFSLFLIVAICSGVYFVNIVVQRARSIGNVLLWTFVGVFVPFGVALIGLIPPAKKKVSPLKKK